MKNIHLFKLIRQNRFTKRAQTARKRSLKLGVKGYFTRRHIENLYVKQHGKCACGCDVVLHGQFEVDHIVSLAKGGSNEPANLQLLTPFCNRSKGKKSMEEFLNER